MKVLNLYACIGGNRKLWTDCEVTAVEINHELAEMYQRRYPNDIVIVGDAHEYLLKYYDKFDFIWSSPPCPTHSRARFWSSKGNEKVDVMYPDMTLYQEIILLQNYYKGLWVVENVDPFYEPLITPTAKIGRHLFWSNFRIPAFDFKEADVRGGKIADWQEVHGFDISDYKGGGRKDQILRNLVHPETGLFIYNRAMGIEIERNIKQPQLF